MKLSVFPMFSTMSVVMTVKFLAPAGTRCMLRGGVNPVVSHMTSRFSSTGHWSFAAGIMIVARVKAEKPRPNVERND